MPYKTKEDKLKHSRTYYKTHAPKLLGRRKELRKQDMTLVRKWRRTARMRRYGITLVDYERMFTAQQGACAICRVQISGHLCIDHRHEDGVVRGLLCTKCNKFLWVLDNPEWLTRAKEYIENFIP